MKNRASERGDAYIILWMVFLLISILAAMKCGANDLTVSSGCRIPKFRAVGGS